MNPELVDVLITSGVTLFIGIAGIFFGKDHSLGKQRRELHLQQLNELYEPLMAYFLFTPDPVLPQESKDAITALLSKHNSLAATNLIPLWQEVLAGKDGSLDKFYTALLSNYNWVKKLLGYPYQEETIKLSYIPQNNFSLQLYVLGLTLSIVAGFLSLWFAKSNDTALLKVECMIAFLACYGVGYNCAHRLFTHATRL